MAATAQFDSDTNPLVEQAMAIGEPASADDSKPTPAVAEPAVGSFENFMTSFGAPARWSGR